ncbi:PREDICTED: heat stress transcription factor A-4c-like [Ipomoea nil]|uniref:heat stress transcription factor A-4c-like n=1 Tax=Ipomoea nil TaxID=35883 RepID=UPI000901ABAF|nr:PREDICTED: heat stress transcription factor A-4c-like [Ipomoea nil]
MDGTQGGSASPAPFLAKTYELVDDRANSAVVSWSRGGRSFVVWNPPEFARDLLPKYFKHNNFSSFIRQLNTYGFRKIDAEQWEFANDEFIRGQTHLLKNIHRRKPIHSHSAQPNSGVPLSEPERREFEEEIERLKQENSSLRVELDRREQENRECRFEFQSLDSRLQSIDERQRQVLALVAQLSLKPDLLHHLEVHNKKRKPSVSNGHLELVNNLDSSITVCQKILNGISNGEEAYGNFETLPQAPSGDSRFSSPSTQTDTPEISSLHTKHPGADGNAKAAWNCAAVDVDRLKDRLEGRSSTAAVPVVGGNDVFWQQFLTEEVESERREIGIRNGRECMIVFAEQMGHFTPATGN